MPGRPGRLVPSWADGLGNTRFPGKFRPRSAAVRQPGGSRVRQDPRLLRPRVAVRAALVRARDRRRGPSDRGVHTGLLPPGARSLPRGDSDGAVPRHAQEPEDSEAPGEVSGHQDQALHPTRLRSPRPEIQTEPRLIEPLDPRIGEIYLSREEIQGRVAELGGQIAADYAGREPVLVTVLKGAFIFLADLSRAIAATHTLDFVVLAAYDGALGGQTK